MLYEWTHTSCTSMTTWLVMSHIPFLFVLVCVFLCVCVWVNEFVYDWLGEWRSGWEYKLGRHIKSSVSCWSGFTWGTTHSLYFPAFQLVYSGTCQASLKAFSMSLTLSQRETSTFPLLGTQPVRNTKKKIAIALLQEVLCLILILYLLFVGGFFCRKLTDF